jgi:DNA-binding beta-propeller fold protein YncE
MDGSGGGVLYYSPGRPNDIALDLKHGKVYFVDGDNGKIVWMDLDGTDVQDLIPGQMDVWADNGIVLDVDGGKIYFTTWDPSDAVKSANLDGSNLQTLYSSPGRPGPITLDLTGGKLYFMDNDTWYVQRMDVGGGGIEDVITDSYVNGLALDPPVPTAIILDRFTGRSAYSLTEAGILLGLVVCLTGFFAVFKRRRDKMEGLC